ncbi:hypothetical protein [Runella slithyformis]|uniref:Uncharacterized protein n=1 Tax=Runella slithyformis (strain ATCC 29530 / DSM 19594 / LMG 11500 / NCIMB 11436 / LSU 4) TaxID=761193 RepID=A0A7U3ZIR3_RUNSL|nr:hypothetical protein [Runella slithyformis]AEI47890.1 hypothetical protein Runsl_1464 [Runella slithyformis DSM 19594]
MILQKIDELIFTGYKEPTSGRSFVLKENAKQAKCTQARFECKQDVLVYKFDKSVKINQKKVDDKFPFLRDIEGLKSMCDFILFYQKPQKLLVVLCNLKSGNKHNCQAQLKSGRIFAEFLVNTAKRYYSSDFDNVTINYRQVLFSSKLLYKTQLRVPSHDSEKIKNYLSNDEITDICNLENLF